MLTRFCTTAAATAAGALALLGLLTLSVAVLTVWAVIAVVTGPLVAMCVHSTRPDPGHAVRVGAAVSAVMLAAGLVTAGLVALLGAVAAPVMALLLAAAAMWVWRHRDISGTPGSPDTTRQPGWAVTAPRHDHRPTRPPLPIPGIAAGATPTAQLCATWQRTYWLLRDLPPTGAERRVVVEIRGQLLDEFERRDPAGFGRWLHTEPRACSDPGRYLAADH